MNDVESKLFEIRAFADWMNETEEEESLHRIAQRIYEILGDFHG